MGDARQDKPDILDAPLLRVPFEGLKRAAKDRKALVDQAGEALEGLAAAAGSPAAQQLAALDQVLSQLQGLKRKLQDVGRQEADEALRVKARLEHLSALGPAPGQDGVVAWNRRRLDRMLVDHMLRTGHHASAGKGGLALCRMRAAHACSSMQHMWARARAAAALTRPCRCLPRRRAQRASRPRRAARS